MRKNIVLLILRIEELLWYSAHNSAIAGLHVILLILSVLNLLSPSGILEFGSSLFGLLSLAALHSLLWRFVWVAGLGFVVHDLRGIFKIYRLVLRQVFASIFDELKHLGLDHV